MATDSRADSFTSLFNTATKGFTPHRWQLQVALDGLPHVLPVPTGLGKTEIALAWAWRLLVDRKPEPLHLVYCLPMRSVVTQTVQRLEGYFDALRVHDSAFEVGVHQLMGGAIDDEWVGSCDQPWVLVGTQDQLLSRALNRGYAMSRFGRQVLWTDAQRRGGDGEATMAAHKQYAITLLSLAPRSRNFDKTAMNAGHTHEEKNRCR